MISSIALRPSELTGIVREVSPPFDDRSVKLEIGDRLVILPDIADGESEQL